MLHRKCWTLLLLPLCLAFYRQDHGARCGVPGAYGGLSIQAYLDNKSDMLVLPWTVAIRNNLGKFKCLGSIIPDNDHSARQKNYSALVLTAGSCFRHSLRKKWGSPRHYKVYAGLDRLRLFLNHGKKSKARAIRIMPYDTVNENIWNGVALVTLKKPFVFNKHISPVCLAGEYAVPPDTSFCFVSTYHKRRLDEEVVRMVPGSVCKFGHFPELARTGGLCSHHERADTEKSLGGPLVCLINGRAHQFGVYLSQLITKKTLSFHKQALHFYGHVSTAFETNSPTGSNVIQLGSTGAHSKPSVSSSSSASEPQEGCVHPPPPPGHRPPPGRPAPPPCVRPPRPPHVVPPGPPHVVPPRPPHVVPPRPPHVVPPRPPPQRPAVYCGDTITFGRSLQSYVVGNNAQDMFPWNVIITTRVRGSTKCIGSLVHKGHERQAVNSSDVVLTAAECFRRRKHSRLRVYAGSPRFSRLRRRGAKVKIASVLLYGLPWENKRIRAGVAILKLQRPLLRKDNVVPVCLAQRESVPPPYASCYVTHYDRHEHRIDEEIVMITRNARCLAAQGSNAPQFRGICAVEQKKKHYIQLGSPMVCIVHGRAYQYGVYLNQLSLKINNRVNQKLGFYSEITIVHEVFAGRNVPTLPDRTHIHPGARPQRPVHTSSSSSSSSSHEFHKRPIGPVPNAKPTLP
ncbi:Trypsin domain containing protein, partial [Trichuris trichiura]